MLAIMIPTLQEIIVITISQITSIFFEGKKIRREGHDQPKKRNNIERNLTPFKRKSLLHMNI